MEVSGYSVEVLGGRHFAGNEQSPSYQMHFPWGVNMNKYDKSYVELTDGQPYRIQMRNTHPTRCNARVSIDGQHVGTWRIGAHRTISIERPANVDKKFTFYRVGSSGGEQAGLNRGDPKNGLLQVEFIPERDYQYEAVVENPLLADRALSSNGRATNNLFAMKQSYMADGSYDEGGTGLHGQSHQRFDRAGKMELNHTKKVLVNLRLVARSQPCPHHHHHHPDRWHDKITPLGQPSSNPIPPPIFR